MKSFTTFARGGLSFAEGSEDPLHVARAYEGKTKMKRLLLDAIWFAVALFAVVFVNDSGTSGKGGAA
ncbi:MAG: hypothetical protein IKO55_05710 [Kiritimatiellae bacterium]|nr:hypothetical protein [Kiritimatiellia bacterium]